MLVPLLSEGLRKVKGVRSELVYVLLCAGCDPVTKIPQIREDVLEVLSPEGGEHTPQHDAGFTPNQRISSPRVYS